MTINHIPSRTITHEGRDYLFFSGTAYLGIQQHPQMQALLAEGVARYGLHFGSSRNGNLQLGIYEELEEKLSAWAGAATALTTSSGMVAGQVVVDWLARKLSPDTIVIQAPGTHPALWHPLIKPQIVPLSGENLSAILQPRNPQPVLILTNSVDALRGEYYDFSWLLTCKRNSIDITLVVDDSHGFGVLNNGRSIYAELAEYFAANGLLGGRLIVTGSLAKAMGLPGGVIFGDGDLAAELRHTAYFGSCSPMPPAYAYAYTRADALYAQGYNQLMRNVVLAEKLLMPTGLFSHDAGYPVFYTDHDDLYPYLLENGIFVYSFAYPTPADKANTRIVISAFHEPQDIENLAVAVRRFAQQHPNVRSVAA